MKPWDLGMSSSPNHNRTRNAYHGSRLALTAMRPPFTPIESCIAHSQAIPGKVFLISKSPNSIPIPQ